MPFWVNSINCSNYRRKLIEEPGEVADELQDVAESCAVHGPWRKKEEILPLLTEEDNNSGDSIKPQQPDLKPLPIELKYAFLDEDNHCLVVISSLLNTLQEENLLDTLRRWKQAIGWKISDLKGISPLVCTHHIYTEEEDKPVR